MLESQSLSPINRNLRHVMSKCRYQQESLRRQKAKLRLQQLNLLEALIQPVRNETPYDGEFLAVKAESELSWQEGLVD